MINEKTHEYFILAQPSNTGINYLANGNNDLLHFDNLSFSQNEDAARRFYSRAELEDARKAIIRNKENKQESFQIDFIVSTIIKKVIL